MSGNEWKDKKEILQMTEEAELLLQQIKHTQNMQSAESYFEKLGQIQLVLARMSFKEDVELSAGLNRFVRDFDRIDDIAARQYMYTKIKNGYTIK
ncbi:MAG: hypothetical protein J0H74_15245 [Chitinophagaceae bacterium]|nr:hypothetical protein [Chitinophagaceae bacterium]